MIAHASLQVSDYEKSKELYTKTLAPLGYHLNMDMPEYKAAGFMQGGNTDFWIGESEKRAPSHIAFLAQNADEVKAWHEAGLAAGATDNGAPGLRKEYSPSYYAAFLHDFDGNNIEAVWFDPSAEH